MVKAPSSFAYSRDSSGILVVLYFLPILLLTDNREPLIKILFAFCVFTSFEKNSYLTFHCITSTTCRYFLCRITVISVLLRFTRITSSRAIGKVTVLISNIPFNYSDLTELVLMETILGNQLLYASITWVNRLMHTPLFPVQVFHQTDVNIHIIVVQ